MAEHSRIDKVLDPDLAEWLDGEGDETREMIVEARMPARTVRLGPGTAERLLPREITSEGDGAGDRAAVLRELQDDLNRLSGRATNLIRAAGAIVVRANREQLLQIARNPLVKAVRSNRRLKPGGVA
jgi:hypothetical protein